MAGSGVSLFSPTRMGEGPAGPAPASAFVQPLVLALEARGGFFEPQFSALTAGVLSFASPKESSQRKGDPRVDAGLCPVPCATRRAGRLRNSGLRPSDRPRRLPPARLRCSASSRGTRKASRHDGSAEKSIAAVNGNFCQKPKNSVRCTGPLERRRATQAGAEKGRALSEGQSPELRSALSNAKHCEEVLLGCPRVSRVAQGTPEGGADPGSPFLCLLSFGEAKKSNAAGQRRKTAVQKPKNFT